MTRYDLLKSNEDVMYQFIKAGILSYQIIRDIQIYEAFNASDLKNNNLKYVLLADEFELTSRRIEQIIYNMQKIFLQKDVSSETQ